MTTTDLVPWIIGLFIIAALMRIDFYFSILYVFMGVYLLGRLWAIRAIRQVAAERKLVDRAFPGEEIKVELVISNQGFLPIPWLEIHDSLPVELISPPYYSEVITLKAYEQRRFNYTLTSYKRGYYIIGPLRWNTGDLFGIIPQQNAYIATQYVIVYPRIVPIEKLGLPTHSPLASLPAPAPLFVDPSRIMGVRNYHIGDSPRSIHWTATARSNSLLVKRYQPAIARETLICLDMDQENYNIRNRYSAIELAILTAASLANHIIVRESLAASLSMQAYDPLEEQILQMRLPMQHNKSHLMHILEKLAKAQGYSINQQLNDTILPFPHFLRLECTRLSWGSTVIVITGEEQSDLIDDLLFVRRQGLAVALILIMPPLVSKELQQRVAMLDIPIYRIWREEALEVV